MLRLIHRALAFALLATVAVACAYEDRDLTYLSVSKRSSFSPGLLGPIE